MKRFIGAAILMISTAALAGADLTKGSQTAAIFGGLGSSSSKYDYQPGTEENVSGVGGAFGAQYLYYVSGAPAFAFGVDLNSSLNGDSDAEDLLDRIDTTARLKSFVGMAVARLSFPRGMARPYLMAGVGMHHSTQRLSGHPQSGATWLGGGTEDRTLIDEDTTSAALGGAIGLDIFPTESFFLGIELRGVWLAGMDTDDTAALRAAGFNVHQENGISQGNLLFRTGIKF